MCHLGDSYDIVKQSLLHWLRPHGKWSVLPMFTDDLVTAEGISAFERMLDAKVVSKERVTLDTDRPGYFARGKACGDLFVDPNTGLRLKETREVRRPEYIFASELVELVRSRPTSALTVVFDQSVPRGSERLHIDGKLRVLRHEGVHGFAYQSHACFIIAGGDHKMIAEERKRVIDASKLPEQRFLPVLA